MCSKCEIVHGDLVVLDISQEILLWDEPDSSATSQVTQKFVPSDVGLVLKIDENLVSKLPNFYLLTSHGAGWAISSFFKKCS
jgi:hypothetical protein